MTQLVIRNLKIFFKDKTAVFFSLLSVLIVVGLYFLFFGAQMAESFYAQGGGDFSRLAVAGLFMGGSIAVATLSTALSGLQQLVTDRENIAKDLTVSPLSQSKIALSYIISSALISLMLSGALLVIVIVYLAIRGSGFIGMVAILQLLFTTALSVVAATAFMYFVILFIKSYNSFSSFTGIMSAGSGFIMGVYVFIGNLAAPIQWVIRLFPMSHSAVMFRQILADPVLYNMFYGNPELLEEMRLLFGTTFQFGGYQSGFWFSAGILALTAVVFFGASLLVLNQRKNLA